MLAALESFYSNFFIILIFLLRECGYYRRSKVRANQNSKWLASALEKSQDNKNCCRIQNVILKDRLLKMLNVSVNPALPGRVRNGTDCRNVPPYSPDSPPRTSLSPSSRFIKKRSLFRKPPRKSQP